MTPRHAAPILGALAMLAACGDDAEKIDAERPAISFFVERDSLATIRYVGSDSLSDSAYVRRLVPEPDSRSIAVIFADPGIGIASGLALLEPERQRVRLVWPDSVGTVWWSGDHRLAFESHTGATHVRAVVDVHADSLEQLRISADSLPTAGQAPPADDAVRARATAYIDSVRGQPGGVPQDGSLRYTVTALSTAPSDSLVAFYVSARAQREEALNPTWYILHVPSGRIAPVDSVIGRAEALRADAAAWSGDRFVFARGDVLYEARIATNSLQ
ncbi:MAG TPA: hypothetical protein VK922_11860 [Gemmatimonadaceae bacterium]|nr:hypothetical protein [Gemmatimonadaceae bacterium]